MKARKDFGVDMHMSKKKGSAALQQLENTVLFHNSYWPPNGG